MDVGAHVHVEAHSVIQDKADQDKLQYMEKRKSSKLEKQSGNNAQSSMLKKGQHEGP